MIAARRADGDGGRLSTRETAKFAGGAALLAIFWDAAVGHGLTWENDPFWTYWITKTFLIFTVFALGTAWLGVGVVRGALITFVHTLILTVYYWTLSPIGTPSSPEWLDLEHTWITGMPIHFGVIYLGYLSGLWLWRRRPHAPDAHPQVSALAVLVVAVLIVALAGGLSSLALGAWPGVTFFVVRLLITVPFVFILIGLVGRDGAAAAAGAIVLAFVWATYGEYLGPLGLPDTPVRVFDEQPPPAESYWLDYRDLWLISLPIYLAAMAATLFVAVRLLPGGSGASRSRGTAVGGLAAVAVIGGAPALANAWVEHGGERAAVSSAGAPQIERGAWFSGQLQPAQATLRLVAENHANKVTPLPPHDELLVDATISPAPGTQYRVVANKPMVSDPMGRHTTWRGVGIDVWHHGRSGIGTNEIAATRSDVAVFGLGTVSRNGRPIATGVPVHVMTGHGDDDEALALHVGNPADPAGVPRLPDGHLRVIWTAHAGDVDASKHSERYWLGNAVLVLLLLFVGGALRSATRSR